MTKGHTPRGFAIYDEFVDLYGSTVRVQESSLATERAVWVFCSHDAPHLDKKMIKRLRRALKDAMRDM